MKRLTVLFSLILLSVGGLTARTQSLPAATASHFSVTVGGMGSIFQPDFAGEVESFCTAGCNTNLKTYTTEAVPSASGQPLFGAGAYVDLKLSRWVQLEGEGRWLRFNQYLGINQSDYLIGPRAPVYRFGRSEVYAKALVGYSDMNFAGGSFNSKFTNFAFGGGVDMKVSKRLSFRAFDFEYQYWPVFGNTSLLPYGASMGIGYKVF
jgi:hypothetical protein